jgi:hypothetical protein
MVTYAAGDVTYRANVAKSEGLTVQQASVNPDQFRVTSGSSPRHFYRVIVKLGTTIDGATCTCQAAERGMQCKHGGAAIMVRRSQIACDAAKALRAHGEWKRRAKARK